MAATSMGGADDVGDAVVLARREADEEIRIERLGHLAGEPAPDALARDAADDLTDEVTLRHRVIARCGARLPPRCLLGQPCDAELPVGQVLGGQGLLPTAQAGGVPHDVAHLNALLAVGAELGPIVGDGRVEVELLTVVQHEGDEERHGLGGGPDVGERVAFPRPRLVLVGPAAPDVDHRLAVEEDGNGGAEVGSAVELIGECPADSVEAWLVGSVHLCHGDPLVVPCGRAGNPGVSGVVQPTSATY